MTNGVEIYTAKENARLHPNSKPITYSINEDGCHICNSHARTKDGYPRITIQGRKNLISRYVWETHKSSITQGLCVMHSCDNPKCINLEHLSLGTHKENMDDRDRKKRMPSVEGFKNPNIALTKEDIINIKKDIVCHPELRQIDLANRYGVQRSTISDIQRGNRWNEIEVEGFSPVTKRKTPVKLSSSQILDIAINKKNLTYNELSSLYGVAHSTVGLIRAGKEFQGVRFSVEEMALG